MLTRARAAIVGCTIWLCGLASPAHAAVVADFDGDGILDTATVVATAHVKICLSISGIDAPLVVALKERPSSLVAADVDRDGLIDLAGISAHHGLFVLRNRDGYRFTRVRAHRRHPLVETALKGDPRRLQDTPVGDGPAAADPTADDPLTGGGAGGVPFDVPHGASTSVQPHRSPAVANPASRPSSPRAPPLSTSAAIHSH
jgi:hypothetical protein